MVDSLVLVSGGCDSVVLLHHIVKDLNKKPFALSFFYGQKHSRELACAHRQCEELGVPQRTINLQDEASKLRSALTGVLEMPTAEEVVDDPQPSTYVPFRNMMFFAVACAQAESAGVGEIYYGAQARDAAGYWDCTHGFMSTMQDLVDLNRRHQILLIGPFLDKLKAEVIELGSKLRVDFAHTWSCYVGDTDPCMECPTCVERQLAFDIARVVDPLVPSSPEGK